LSHKPDTGTVVMKSLTATAIQWNSR